MKCGYSLRDIFDVFLVKYVVFSKTIKIEYSLRNILGLFFDKIWYSCNHNTNLEKLFENFESDEREEGRKKERMNERMKE